MTASCYIHSCCSSNFCKITRPTQVLRIESYGTYELVRSIDFNLIIKFNDRDIRESSPLGITGQRKAPASGQSVSSRFRVKCIFKIQPVSGRQVRKIVPDSGCDAGRAVPDPQFKDSSSNLDKARNHDF